MTAHRSLCGTPLGGAVVVRSALAAALVVVAESPADAADVRISGPSCAVPGSVIEVELVVDPDGAMVVGLQALLTFDDSVLRLLSFESGDEPYVVPIWSSCDESIATVDVAVGFDPSNGQNQSPVAVAKRMRFEVLPSALACATADLIRFREEPPFRTMLTLPGGQRIDPQLAPLGAFTVSPVPAFEQPADMTVVPPLDADCALPDIVPPQVVSECGAVAEMTFVRSDGATSLSAPICRVNAPVTITWTATDGCGRSASAEQVISVPGLPADLNVDGMVDAYDLAVVLGAWGSASGAGDLNGDRVVDGTDLAMLLGRWTDSIP